MVLELHQIASFFLIKAIKLNLKIIKNFRCVTTKGSVLNTSTFTAEDDNSEQMSNDDKILTTALNLCKNHLDKKTGKFYFKILETLQTKIKS